MQEMIFKDVGRLPAAGGEWYIRTGGGHVWFVNEDRAAGVFALIDDVLTPVVDAAEHPEAPLIQPKAYA